jgi:hypothetical protein
MMKKLALLISLFLMSCGGVAAAPTPSAHPTAIVAASPTPNLPGSTLSMPVEPEMIGFFADAGSLIAISTKEGPSPYKSKIWRAEGPSGSWRPVYESDAAFMLESVSSGRIAFMEYRSPYQGGGAYSENVVVVDLATGQKTEMDQFSLTAATYRGGGGGARRPVGSVAIGPDHAAWTRLVEGPGGSISGELRIGPLADPASAQTIASSTEFVTPLAVDAHRLVYVLGTTTEDQLLVRDLGNGAEKTVASAAVGDTVKVGSPGLDRAVVSGDWAVWFDQPRAESTAGHAVNLVTGDERALRIGGAGCAAPSAGSRYFAWFCSRSSGEVGMFEILDAQTLAPSSVIPAGTGFEMTAAGGGLLWFNATRDGRTVTYFRPN